MSTKPLNAHFSSDNVEWLTLTEDEVRRGGLESIKLGDWLVYLRFISGGLRPPHFRLSVYCFGRSRTPPSPVINTDFYNWEEARAAAEGVERIVAVWVACQALGLDD